MRFDEFEGFGPEGGHGLWGIVEIDREAVGFIVVLHVVEDVVVDVAEKVDFGFYSPVITYVLQSGVVVKETAVPATHLVVGNHVAVLYVMLFEYLGAFLEEVVVDPAGDGPVFFGDELIVAFGFCFGAGAMFEFFGEGDVVEEGPGVVELVVPGSFEVFHGLDHAVDFFIADEGEDCCVDAGGVWVVGGVVVCSP